MGTLQLSPSPLFILHVAKYRAMLVLESLHELLEQSISPFDSKTPQGPRVAALITPGSGALISLASMPGVPRDDAKVLCALATEIWNQAASGQGKKKAEERYACGESEFGRVLVWPVPEDEKPPVLLLALAGSEKADWDELGSKADQLAKHLTPAVSPLREKLAPKVPIQQKR